MTLLQNVQEQKLQQLPTQGVMAKKFLSLLQFAWGMDRGWTYIVYGPFTPSESEREGECEVTFAFARMAL